MNDKKTTVIKHYPFTILAIILIWILCLIPIPETPLSGVSLIDKWTHFALFGALTILIWVETLIHQVAHTKKSMALWGALMPWLMGGLIEIAQATLTNGVRNGDVLDFLADGIGVILGVVIGILLERYSSIGNKD
ncbi:MAG: VanZ family protein [Prevotella sp.]